MALWRPDWTGSCIPYDSGPSGDIGTAASFPSGPGRRPAPGDGRHRHT
ncbi:hypothetical protein SCALM49S_05026 [Streptomyces californicus]